MIRIDSDAHVDETEQTWEFLDPGDRRLTPLSIDGTDGPDKLWSTDGMEFRRPVRDYRRTGATEATSQLLDVPARLQDLDELHIDIQVLCATVFIRTKFAGHEALELALTRAYNRWLASRTERAVDGCTSSRCCHCSASAKP